VDVESVLCIDDGEVNLLIRDGEKAFRKAHDP
jgi:hypothetical protein